MNRMVATLLVLSSVLSELPVVAAPLYEVLNLGGDGIIAATGVNDSGQVVGHLYAPSPEIQAFRTEPNSTLNLPTDNLTSQAPYSTDDRYGGAEAINSSGQVAGFGSSYLHGYHPMTWAPNSSNGVFISPLPFITMGQDPTGGMAYAINGSGQAAGTVTMQGSGTFAFRTAPNSAINPATDVIVANGIAFGLNSLGQAVGAAPVGFSEHAFRTAPNLAYHAATDDLGTLGGSNSTARAINTAGQVVGEADTDISGFIYSDNFGQILGNPHAFMTAPNSKINPLTDDLGTLGGSASWATAINERGDVVGHSLLAGDAIEHAFLYTSGRMLDLNDLVGSSLAGIYITSAVGINNRGQIAVNAVSSAYGGYFGGSFALLLTPVPEPSSLVLAAFGSIVLAARRWRRSKKRDMARSSSPGPGPISRASATTIGSKAQPS
jgi:probable HAF family extracellular repeat protein